MRTITFYSYKGGVGRTLAAANFAVYLAKLGLKTVIIDFDLEAPGIDAKFPLLKLPDDQKGVLDYIIHYQKNNSALKTLESICVQVPTESSDSTVPLWLIPAGQYLSEEYYKNLSQLDWGLIFSSDRNGVAFFQQFLAQIKQELQADYVIIDSRTGITEIAGVCTQQLADEVVMLSSLSSESIKVTKHIKELIENSQVAKALKKSIDVKVVVSRVPKPDDLEGFKKRCCKLFDIPETKLFFLFSCSLLEREEFLAISNASKDEELVSNYVRLFYGLNLELADQNIREEIQRISSQILLVSVEEAEKNVLGLVALYPHPEAYKTAMNFFRLRRKTEEMRNFGWKLFDLTPDNEEVQRVIANSYLSLHGLYRLKIQDKMKAVKVIEYLWNKKKLNPKERMYYASMLEDLKAYEDSLRVALDLYEDEGVLDDKNKSQARSIAARSALKLGQDQISRELIADIPIEDLDTSLAKIAIEMRQKDDDIEGAFEIAKQVLEHDINPDLLRQAQSLAKQLNRVDEFQEVIQSSRVARTLMRRDSHLRREIRQLSLLDVDDDSENEEDSTIQF